MNPTCLCCGGWAEHLEQHGFEVEIHYTEELSAFKAEHGIRDDLTGCQTAMVNGYIVEGHVPGDVIQRLLEERPRVPGFAVPGMLMGSPGMERSDPPESYEVIVLLVESL